ncbi:MAG: hypothetical protein A2075_05395 [Geobacteraceae bacterium GWC2_58_44]|nr:MAG: hypothetical protein A2075_05395 [Geobacteraceae bacterium GWC2_58_44]HBG08204.1 hypothetical protein [Geobacter sp.]
MLNNLNNLDNIGDDVYRTWSHEQCQDEIGKLVQGYKNGLPVQILCQLATSIAGTSSLAGEHISAFLTLKERKAIIKKESGGNKELRNLLESTLL